MNPESELGVVLMALHGKLIIGSTDEETEAQRQDSHVVVRGSNPAPPASGLIPAHRMPGSRKPRLWAAALQLSFAFSSSAYCAFATLVE